MEDGSASVSVLALPVQVDWAKESEDASNKRKVMAPSKHGKSLDRMCTVVVMSLFIQLVDLVIIPDAKH